MNNSYTTPLGSPLYPKPPYTYNDTHWILITYESRVEFVKDLLPELIKPVSDKDGKIFVAVYVSDFRDTSVGSYKSCGLGLKVSFKDKMGSFFTDCFVTTDTAIAAGREIWGVAKKLADIDLTFNGDTGIGTVRRDEVELLKITFVKESIGNENDLPNLFPSYNYKLIPGSVNSKPIVKQLLSFKTDNGKIKQLWRGNSTLKFEPHVTSNMFKLKPIKILDSFYMVMDYTQTYSKIAHDFLK